MSNIGFDVKATHWNVKNIDMANLPARNPGVIHHPQSMQIDSGADRMIFEKLFNRVWLSNLAHLAIFLIDRGIKRRAEPALKGIPETSG